MLKSLSLLLISTSLLCACASGDLRKNTDRTTAAATSAMTERSTAENVERVDDTQNIGDAILTPLSDINVKQQDIPQILENIINPYARKGTSNCRSLTTQIADLDAVLGRDFDEAGFDEADFETKALNVTSSVVGSLIPFRGLVRTATGASKYDRKVQRAYRRGVTRRAYLKGIAKQKRCK